MHSLCVGKQHALLYTTCWWKEYTEVNVTIPWVPETFLARFQVCRPSANTENSRRTREHYLWNPGYSNEVLAFETLCHLTFKLIALFQITTQWANLLGLKLTTTSSCLVKWEMPYSLKLYFFCKSQRIL